jgi:hypothetical protein
MVFGRYWTQSIGVNPYNETNRRAHFATEKQCSMVPEFEIASELPIMRKLEAMR